ncbi:MAG: UvrD-helicase domain-containing protein [Clostridia bacterium]|nr:UvrD-helicase domain-containing protein [Clostridia bacterium]
MTQNLNERFTAAKRALFHKLYSQMNDKQREAIFTVNNPLLILAGAGSGKTTVLVNRIAHIIRYGNAFADDSLPAGVGEAETASLEAAAADESIDAESIAKLLSPYAVEPCPPWAILAITFTNKAAKEMKERLGRVLGDEAVSGEIWASTFHSTCVRILRRWGETIGYARDFSIYDTDDQKKLITACQKELNLDDKMFPVRATMSTISKAKDHLLTPDEFDAEAGSDYRLQKIGEVYHLYALRLREANALDFDDLILQTVRLLKRSDEAREYYQNRFRYVCVDEYQDTNKAQFELTRLLSGKHRNLMVVGDDDQSIYKFRGATIENILDFDKSWEDARIIKLEQNYRSTQNILTAANAVIKHNFARRGKELWCDKGEGDKIRVKKLQTQNDEARYIINKILDGVTREKRKYSDFAVLYRMNAQSNNLENYFAKSGIPYRMLGGVRFYERKEIKDIIAYLCVLLNPNDTVRLRRIINEPKRKIGDTTIDAVFQLAEAEKQSPFVIMEQAQRYVAISKTAPRLNDFVQMIRQLKAASETMPVSELIKLVLERTGYAEMLKTSGIEGLERIANVGELINNAVAYEEDNPEASLTGFLEDVALVSDVDNYDETADAVVLMTIHSAKGLEFPVVFLPGFEDGIFPSIQSAMNPEDLEEERRLAYVAITRAKERLYCVHVRERLIFGKTQFNPRSRFIDEIPEELIDLGYIPKPDPAQQTGRSRKPVISKEFLKKADLASEVGRAETSEHLEVGDRVQHITFGEGEILSAKPMGADIMYEIAFNKVGTKKLMATYAKLKKI